MNRRELFGRMGAIAAGAATASVAAGSPMPVDVEPPPDVWRIDALELDQDVSVMGVSVALAQLGWQSGLTPKPLLCVRPSEYAQGIDVAGYFGGAVQAWATNTVPKMFAWAVKWRGRMVGSNGA